MPVRDPHATIAALLRMTVDRGCTPHEAATAKDRAKAIAARLGLDLETYVSRPEAPRHEDFMRRQRADQAERERRAREEFERMRREQHAREYEEARRFFSLPPQQARLIEILQKLYATGRSGAHVDTLRWSLGGLEPHTVRAMISRLRKAGFKIRTTRVDGGAAYFYEP